MTIRVTRPIPLHVLKVVLMQDHAVILESKSSVELGVSWHLVLVYYSVCEDVCDSLIEIVGSLYVTLVQLEMHLKSLVRDAVQAAEVELSRVVCAVIHFLGPRLLFARHSIEAAFLIRSGRRHTALVRRHLIKVISPVGKDQRTNPKQKKGNDGEPDHRPDSRILRCHA